MATKLYDADWIDGTLRRLADEIAADPKLKTGLALVGTRTRGAVLAERLAGILRQRGRELALGFIDTTMYRDDLHTGAGLKRIQATQLDFDLNDRALVLVDDVLATGRTIRAALDALLSYGRPACIRLLVMLDRDGREMPIQPDFLGTRVEVPAGGFVRLRLHEVDAGDAVYRVGPEDEEPE